MELCSIFWLIKVLIVRSTNTGNPSVCLCLHVLLATHVSVYYCLLFTEYAVNVTNRN